MSTQQLADALQDLGLDLKRPVLSNLENRRRGTVSVAEVYAISAVLRVPPTALLAPLDDVQVVEPLPGVEVDPWTAHEWLRGRGPLAEGPTGPLEDAVRTSGRLDDHQEVADHLRSLVEEMLSYRKAGDEELADRTLRAVRVIAASLGQMRRQLRAAGLTPPELPPELWPVDTPGYLPGVWGEGPAKPPGRAVFGLPAEGDEA